MELKVTKAKLCYCCAACTSTGTPRVHTRNTSQQTRFTMIKNLTNFLSTICHDDSYDVNRPDVLPPVKNVRVDQARLIEIFMNSNLMDMIFEGRDDRPSSVIDFRDLLIPGIQRILTYGTAHKTGRGITRNIRASDYRLGCPLFSQFLTTYKTGTNSDDVVVSYFKTVLNFINQTRLRNPTNKDL
ncbi:hypothetical protein GEMRC1_012872 [Eukaryota sp. GEM-RC1]